MTPSATATGASEDLVVANHPGQPLDQVFQALRSSPEGLSQREAERRLIVYGPNVLSRRGTRRWPKELAAQFTHPLAILLGAAAVLSLINGSPVLAAAVTAVILLNAVFAFFQEQHAEHAVEALAQYLPQQASIRRDHGRAEVDAAANLPA